MNRHSLDSKACWPLNHMGQIWERAESSFVQANRLSELKGYLWASPGLTLVVFVSGLMTVFSAALTTIQVAAFTSHQGQREIVLLVAAFAVNAIGVVFKTRSEMLLTVVVRQIAFRRIRLVNCLGETNDALRQKLLTYPAQISQIAFCVDFVVSAIEIILISAIAFRLYGATALYALILLGVLVLVSVRLIKRVGKLWEEYTAQEGRRRDLIGKVSASLPRGRTYPGYSMSVDRIAQIRASEEVMLHKRVKLQAANSIVDRSGLTILIVVSALVSLSIHPEWAGGISLLLAIGYIFNAVQNNLTNFRVIRLARPMVQDLRDTHRRALTHRGDPGLDPFPDLAGGPQMLTVVEEGSAEARAAREKRGMGTIVLPALPTISGPVVRQWLSPDKEHLLGWTRVLGLYDDVVSRAVHAPETLSNGERARVALAEAFASDPAMLVLDGTLETLDVGLRAKTLDLLARRKRRSIVINHSFGGFAQETNRVHHDTVTGAVDEAPVSEPEPRTGREFDEFDPEPGMGLLRRAAQTVFGLPGQLTLILGVLFLTTSQVMMVTQLDSVGGARSVLAWIVCGACSVLGAGLMSVAVNLIPIKRLSRVHAELLGALPNFSNHNTAGMVVSRLGEDFSEIQMSIPGRLASIVIVLVSTVTALTIATAGDPKLGLFMLLLLPVAAILYRISARDVNAMSQQSANARGRFLGSVNSLWLEGFTSGELAASHVRESAYSTEERKYLSANVALANAYTKRSILMSLWVFTVNGATVVLLANSAGRARVSESAVLYFVLAFTVGVQRMIEVLVESGVAGLTVGRVLALFSAKLGVARRGANDHAVAKVAELVEAGVPLVGIQGPSGVGKTLLLEEVADRFSPTKCTVYLDSSGSLMKPDEPRLDVRQIAALRSAMMVENALICMDEALNALDQERACAEITKARINSIANGSTIVMVSHNPTHFQACDEEVSLS